MEKRWLWYLAKGLEGVGMIVVLIGLLLSIQLGMNEQGLASMRYEGNALALGGGLFLVGWLIERGIGAR